MASVEDTENNDDPVLLFSVDKVENVLRTSYTQQLPPTLNFKSAMMSLGEINTAVSMAKKVCLKGLLDQFNS